VAGIDRQTIADVEQHGIAKLLDELVTDLGMAAIGRFRPAGCLSQSPAGWSSKDRCRFPLSVIASFSPR